MQVTRVKVINFSSIAILILQLSNNVSDEACALFSLLVSTTIICNLMILKIFFELFATFSNNISLQEDQ